MFISHHTSRELYDDDISVISLSISFWDWHAEGGDLCVGSLTVCTAKWDLWFHNLLHAYSFNIQGAYIYTKCHILYFKNQWKDSIAKNITALKDFDWKLCIQFWKGLNCKYKFEWLFHNSEVQVYTNEVEQAIWKSVCYQCVCNSIFIQLKKEKVEHSIVMPNNVFSLQVS